MMGDDPPAGSSASPGLAGSEDAQSPFAALDRQADPQGSGEEFSAAATVEALRLDLVLDIPVRLSVELGRTEIPIREVVNLGRGSLIELDRNAGEPLDVRVNGVLIGRGEVVVINEERLGLRFTEVVSHSERVKPLG
jgi:flagellar motor switch protein FliN/FliY